MIETLGLIVYAGIGLGIALETDTDGIEDDPFAFLLFLGFMLTMWPIIAVASFVRKILRAFA